MAAGIGMLLAAPPAGAQDTFFKEAPVLAERVAAGLLPPVAERLPRNPVLLQTVERPGEYGGTWHMAMRGNDDRAFVYRYLGYEHLVRWDPAWTRVIPNVAQSYTANAEATEFTFQLRQGMRWSDGHPFTADDIMFWYEDVLGNPELTPTPPDWLVAGGQPVEVEKLGPYSVRFRFAASYGLFLHQLASAHDSPGPAGFPKHWLQDFHPRYNEGGLEAEIAAAGARDWVELFQLKSGDEHVPKGLMALFRLQLGGDTETVPEDFEPWPTLDGWMLTGVEDGDPPRIEAARNPFYWKIDAAGRQLPYIDDVAFHTFTDRDDIRAFAVAGMMGMQSRRLSDPTSYKVLKEHEKEGDYRFFAMTPSQSNTLALAFNLTHPDPGKRALFANRDFRVAMSLAIDRKAVIEVLTGSVGQPYQIAPRPESRFYNPRLAGQYLEHDPGKADALLDSIGLNRRDGEGFRLKPDGQRATFGILVREDQPHHITAIDMIVEDWRAVGIDAVKLVAERPVLLEFIEANAFDAAVAHSEGGIEALLYSDMYVPLSGDSVFGIGWVRWFDDPDHAKAVEPPPQVQEQVALHRRLKRTVAAEEQDNLMQRILDIAADQFYAFGISLEPERWGYVHNNFRNVPPVMVWSWTYPNPAPTNPAQYFIAEP